jgi:hypothetical protein
VRAGRRSPWKNIPSFWGFLWEELTVENSPRRSRKNTRASGSCGGARSLWCKCGENFEAQVNGSADRGHEECRAIRGLALGPSRDKEWKI